jgi:hypothetical protein
MGYFLVFWFLGFWGVFSSFVTMAHFLHTCMRPLIVQLKNTSTIILLLVLGYMLYVTSQLFNFFDQEGRSREASFLDDSEVIFFPFPFVLFCFSICFVSISFL